MNIKCPVCQAEYHIGPGKYRCKCGAKFFVKEPEVVLDATSDSPEYFGCPVQAEKKHRPPRRGGLVLRMFLCILVGLLFGYGLFKYVDMKRAAEDQLASGMQQPDAPGAVWSPSKATRQHRSTHTADVNQMTDASRAADKKRMPEEKNDAESEAPAETESSAEKIVRQPEVKSVEEEESPLPQFNEDRKVLLKVPENLAGEYSIPPGVTVIGPYAFANCRKLTAVHIPDGVVRIGEMAFFNCSSLTKLRIPDSIINIEMRAFYKCTKLTRVEIPENISLIGRGVFTGCHNLQRVVLPAEFRWKVFHLGIPSYCTVSFRKN